MEKEVSGFSFEDLESIKRINEFLKFNVLQNFVNQHAILYKHVLNRKTKEILRGK